MSSEDSKSVALAPQHSDNDNSESNSNAESQIENNEKDSIASNNESKQVDVIKENDQVIRSESVIKSPSKPVLSSPTPVIQVVDTSSQNMHSECNSEIKKSHTDTCQIVNTTTSTANVSFLQSFSSITPNNPFLRATSFHSNSASTCSENSESDSENPIVFAPPKLIPNSFSNKSEKSFLHPSILKTSESNLKDLQKPNETISSSKTFISLNKEDIGKIKTPEFIKITSLNLSNGNKTDNKDVKTQENTENTLKTTSFLFGQKLEDRVVFDSLSHNDLKPDNTTSDHLISFSDVTKCEETIKNASSDSKTDDTKSECSSSTMIKNGDNVDSVFKRKYEVITGEEDEQNVLAIYGKLFAWDSDKASWVEKGRGHLRLNDVMKNDKLCSRLVMRTAGALRLILNAHIVVGMTFELASENCLRFTYVDGIYMIKANPKDIDQLHSAIEHRLREISSKRIKAKDDNDEQ